MRLIDADLLIKNIEAKGFCKEDVLDEINNQPTAYDVDKVVEWLEDGRQQALSMADESEYFLGQLALLNRVIPLVKGGSQGD